MRQSIPAGLLSVPAGAKSRARRPLFAAEQGAQQHTGWAAPCPEKAKTRRPLKSKGLRVELLARVELATSSLPRMRSTY